MCTFEREFHHVTRLRPNDVRSRHHAKAHAVNATYTRDLEHFRASSRTGCLSVAGCTESGDSPSRSEKEVNGYFPCLKDNGFVNTELIIIIIIIFGLSLIYIRGSRTVLNQS